MIKRVAMLCLHSSPLAPLGAPDAGGMNLYVRRLAVELGLRGVEVDVFTRRSDRNAPEVVQLHDNARVVHVDAGPPEHVRKRVLPLYVPAMVNAISSFAARRGRQYDLIHSHYWISGMAGTRFQLHTDAPHIHMFHTLSRVKTLYSGASDPADSALRPDGERCVLERAEVIVGAAPAERELLGRLYGRAPRAFHVIPPGVDHTIFRPRSQSASRRRLGFGVEPLILFVGRRDPIKRFDLLLEAFALVRKTLAARVVVVGEQPDAHTSEAKEMQDTLRRLDISAAVEFRGRVGQHELPYYYAAADVLAMPSAYETFGMAALEAMACQTPVVAFPVGGLATFVLAGRTGYIARQDDVADFARQLEVALTDSEREVIGRRARLVAQQYTWNGTAERTLALYEAVARQQRVRIDVSC